APWVWRLGPPFAAATRVSIARCSPSSFVSSVSASARKRGVECAMSVFRIAVVRSKVAALRLTDYAATFADRRDPRPPASVRAEVLLGGEGTVARGGIHRHR